MKISPTQLARLKADRRKLMATMRWLALLQIVIACLCYYTAHYDRWGLFVFCVAWFMFNLYVLWATIKNMTESMI